MAESDKHLSVAECRALLGADAEGWTDERIEKLRDRLEALAHVLVPIVKKVSREDLEALKQAAYTHRHGLDREDLIQDPDFDNEENTEVNTWPVN